MDQLQTRVLDRITSGAATEVAAFAAVGINASPSRYLQRVKDVEHGAQPRKPHQHGNGRARHHAGEELPVADRPVGDLDRRSCARDELIPHPTC